jgi:MORN repeat
VYMGGWEDNLQNGHGTYLYLADNIFRGDKYVGEWKYGRPSGYKISSIINRFKLNLILTFNIFRMVTTSMAI